MGTGRLQSRDDQVAEADVVARAGWCRRILDHGKGTRARAEVIAEAMAALGLGRTAIHNLLAAYEAEGVEGLRRRPRRDAGRARALSAQDLELWLDYALRAERQAWSEQQLCRNFRGWFERLQGHELGCSDATLRRALAQADPAFRMTRREARRSRKRVMRMGSPYPNFLWQGDQRTADLWVVDEPGGRPYRPYLFHFVDTASGVEMGGGYYPRYDTATVEAALLDAIYPDAEHSLPFCGTPEHLYWDNGEQHCSHWIRRVCQTLGIEITYSVPAEPTSHGFIEGTHRLAQEFEREQPRFCGSDNREESRPLRVRQVRDDDRPEEAPLTLAELNGRWKRWLSQDLLHRRYRDGDTRCSRWLREVPEERTRVPAPEQLAWELMRQDTRTVTAGKVHFCNLVYTAAGLADFNGLEVEVRYLESDIHRLWVVSGGRAVAVAEPEDRHLYLSVDSFREWRARCAEGREALRGLDESAALLRAAAAGAGVDAAEAEQAARTVERTQRALRPGQAAALRRRLGMPEEDDKVVPLRRPPAVREVAPPAVPGGDGLREFLRTDEAPAAPRRPRIDEYL